MSFVGETLSGGAGKASKKAARILAAATDRAIAAQKENLATVRADLQPFREAGEEQLDPLTSLISDPGAQRDFVLENPFFNALADDAQNRLFANQAARGKVGSGGTAEALQNSLLLLGQDLLSQNINQRFNLASMGQNAAAGQATATQQTGANITDLITSGGSAQASGVVGAANARAQGISNLIQGTVAGVALSDIRAKESIERIGTVRGFPLYHFRYRGDDEIRTGLMAQDVEKVRPDAVIEIDGLKHIDYGVLWQSIPVYH